MNNESHVADEFEDEDDSLLNPFELSRKRENYGTSSNFQVNHTRYHIPSKSIYQSYGWIFCFIIFVIVIFGYSLFGISPRNTSTDFKIYSNHGVANSLDNGDNGTNTVLEHTKYILRSPSIKPTINSK